MENVFVVAKLVAKPGKEETLANELKPLVPLVRAEPGCIRYDLHRAQDGSGTFMLYEIWADAAALDVHAKASNLVDFVARTKDIMDGALDITLWKAVDTVK